MRTTLVACLVLAGCSSAPAQEAPPRTPATPAPKAAPAPAPTAAPAAAAKPLAAFADIAPWPKNGNQVSIGSGHAEGLDVKKSGKRLKIAKLNYEKFSRREAAVGIADMKSATVSFGVIKTDAITLRDARCVLPDWDVEIGPKLGKKVVGYVLGDAALVVAPWHANAALKACRPAGKVRVFFSFSGGKVQAAEVAGATKAEVACMRKALIGATAFRKGSCSVTLPKAK